MQPTNALAGKRVLIAEDEPVIAMDHAVLLTEAGAEVVATCATVRRRGGLHPRQTDRRGRAGLRVG
jgi:hypothetical protein